MTSFTGRARRRSCYLMVFGVVLLALPLNAGTGRVRIIQTNSAGDNVHVIDPATNTVAAVITGIEANHGAAVAPDGSALYFSNEADLTLDVVDGVTLKITKKIPLTGRPNNITISKDGRRVYVGIYQQPGGVDVIDTVSLARIKTIPTFGGIHNLYVTPDGKYLIPGSPPGQNITVIDTKTDRPVWALFFEDRIGPFTFETKADGSTQRIFVQIGGHHGFVVVDFEKRREVGRIKFPDLPPELRHLYDGTLAEIAPAHGIGISPDGKTLWGVSIINGHVYVYSMPDLKLLGGVVVGSQPEWITFTPDSKFAYVANTGSHDVSVVDVKLMKEVTRIPVGWSPKRNITAVLP